MSLTAAQRKLLRARAHPLKAIVLVGDAGLSEAVIAETDRALEHHELVKIRLPGVDREQRAHMAKALCEAVGAQQVQAIGRVQVLFRPRPIEPTAMRHVHRAAPATRHGKSRQR